MDSAMILIATAILTPIVVVVLLLLTGVLSNTPPVSEVNDGTLVPGTNDIPQENLAFNRPMPVHRSQQKIVSILKKEGLANKCGAGFGGDTRFELAVCENFDATTLDSIVNNKMETDANINDVYQSGQDYTQQLSRQYIDGVKSESIYDNKQAGLLNEHKARLGVQRRMFSDTVDKGQLMLYEYGLENANKTWVNRA